jgi:two-component system, OmpR family, sensor kinase
MDMVRALRSSLWIKLVSAFLLVAVAGVAVVSLLANQATVSGLRRFLASGAADDWTPLQASLAAFYAREGSWSGVEGLLTAVQPGRGQGSMGLTLLDERGQAVASAGGQRNRPATAADADLSLPIVEGGRQVGLLLVRAPGAGMSRAGQQFLSEVNRAIVWGGLAAVMLALALSVVLARRLTQPLRRLTLATHEMATGKLRQQVPVNTGDEIGQLADSFNQMAAALEEAEQQRRQLLADVAHELRTPLSVMRSHLEAMMDGVFDLTPDNLAIAHEETVLLGRLVEDLRTLSLAEGGQLPLAVDPIDLDSLVNQAIAAFGPLAEAEGVRLVVDLQPDLPPAKGDRQRIQQVVSNLLANGIRHAAGESPEVVVTASLLGGALRISVADNGPGLTPEAQQHVFDRFWRTDAARSRDQGGSGLGLAICRAIVGAYGGQIWVESGPGRGAAFHFTLPAAPG